VNSANHQSFLLPANSNSKSGNDLTAKNAKSAKKTFVFDVPILPCVFFVPVVKKQLLPYDLRKFQYWDVSGWHKIKKTWCSWHALRFVFGLDLELLACQIRCCLMVY
jgi:hypothetical protein